MDETYFRSFEAYIREGLIKSKVESGEPVTDEEKDFLEKYRKYREKREKKAEQERAYALQAPERERKRREKAIEMMREKTCPFLKENCVGEKCALLKVLVKRHDVYPCDGEKHYEAMCALNVPDAGSRIEYK